MAGFGHGHKISSQRSGRVDERQQIQNYGDLDIDTADEPDEPDEF